MINRAMQITGTNQANIRFKTSMLQSDLCDYSVTYIVVKGTSTVAVLAEQNSHGCDKKLAFKNNVPFINCISKINNTLTDNAEDLDVVLKPMYNMLECSKNYSKTSASLWNYYRDEPYSSRAGGINLSIRNSKSFDYTTSITEKLEGIDTTKNVEIAVPLKYLSNFWRTLDLPLINCEVSLTLTWAANFVLRSKAKRDADINAGPAVVAINNPTGAKFEVSHTKLYVPVVTLSTQDDDKPLQQLKTGFKRTIKWNKYRPEMSNQTKNINLNFFIDPTFTKTGLFVLSFENEHNRTSFSQYYTPNVEIEGFNLLIDGKSFFDTPIKNKEAYEKIIEMGRNSDNTTGNLLDYEYFSKHYKLIAIDLSTQIE